MDNVQKNSITDLTHYRQNPLDFIYDTESLSFDFQQNFRFPHSPVNEIYYVWQLWEFHFCIYSGKEQRGTMFMWLEFKGCKGVNEVIYCLHYCVKNILPDNVRQLHLFSDACPG
jgi:hypothetical protein